MKLRLFLALTALLLSTDFAGAAARPNVIIFLADDAGWGDYSFNGNTNFQTPNIDSLARDGAMFERFYVCPVCSPTRAEMLTGRYHLRTGVRGVSEGQERLNLDESTLADSFKAAGYVTGAFGKWHNGSQWPFHPNARGFDEYYGFTSGHWGEYFDPPLERNGTLVRGKGFIADDLTGKALEFIGRNKEKPFLCYVPFNTPHSPWAAPADVWVRYKERPIGLRGGQGEKEQIETTRCALAMMENLDANVGRVLAKLDELKLRENTIVIYFSDNGPNSDRWNGGMKGRKGTTDEGGVRSPLLLRWPGHIKAGTRVKEIAGAIDLLPTLAAMSGVKHIGSKPLDGRDLSPLLSGTSAAWPERIIFSTWAGKASVRSQRYRLDYGGALYDMDADPAQKVDVASRELEVAAKMRSALADWRKELGPQAPEARPYPVGYTEFPVTPLPARDGRASGGIERSANAPNSSYFVNWRTLDGCIVWDVDVHTAGEYEAVIYYTAEEAGAMVELSLNAAKLSAKVQPAWAPPLYSNQDTIPRPVAESKMKEFRPLSLGFIRLEKGRGPLTLRALEIPGKHVMDVRAVYLTLRK